jgi:hypothetical protein
VFPRHWLIGRSTSRTVEQLRAIIGASEADIDVATEYLTKIGASNQLHKRTHVHEPCSTLCPFFLERCLATPMIVGVGVDGVWCGMAWRCLGRINCSVTAGRPGYWNVLVAATPAAAPAVCGRVHSPAPRGRLRGERRCRCCVCHEPWP